MDASEQRTWSVNSSDNSGPVLRSAFRVVSAYTLLQSYKLYQCVDTFLLADDHVSPSTSTWLLIKWCALDALIIGYVIPRLRLPKLDWPPLSRLLLLMPLCFLNWLIFSTAAWTWLASIPTSLLAGFLPDYRMAVDEHRVRFGRLQDPTEHILGSHTVHVLPHASARMAPQEQSYCLPVDKKATISIPLLFNNTSPHSVQYSLTDPLTNEKTLFDVSEAQIRAKARPAPSQRPEDQDDWGLPIKSAVKQHHFLTSGSSSKGHSYVLQVSKPGILRLERLISEPPHADIPFSRVESILIVSCPTAHLDSAPQLDICQGAATEAKIAISGVPPLALDYVRSSDSTQTPQELKLEGITPPNVLAEGVSANIKVPVDVRLQQTGRHHFQLSRITDKLGNSVPLLPEETKKVRSGKKPDNAWDITVHGSASARIQGCSSKQPLKLLHNSKVHFGVAVEGVTSGEGPYEAGMLYPDGSTKTVAITETNTPSSRLVKTIEVCEAGQYELLGLNSRFCEGQVQSPVLVGDLSTTVKCFVD